MEEHVTPTRGRRPSPDQEEVLRQERDHWHKVGHENLVQAATKLEDAAKQLVTLTGALQGLYFAVLVMGDLQRRVGQSPLILFVLLPVGLWLAGMACATLVFVPRVRMEADLDDRRERAWMDLRESYRVTVERKRRWLHWAHGLLVVSFAAVFMLLTLLIVQAAPPATTEPIRVILVTPTP
jgi:hypothetical protein